MVVSFEFVFIDVASSELFPHIHRPVNSWPRINHEVTSEWTVACIQRCVIMHDGSLVAPSAWGYAQPQPSEPLGDGVAKSSMTYLSDLSTSVVPFTGSFVNRSYSFYIHTATSLRRQNFVHQSEAQRGQLDDHRCLVLLANVTIYRVIAQLLVLFRLLLSATIEVAKPWRRLLKKSM